MGVVENGLVSQPFERRRLHNARNRAERCRGSPFAIIFSHGDNHEGPRLSFEPSTTSRLFYSLLSSATSCSRMHRGRQALIAHSLEELGDALRIIFFRLEIAAQPSSAGLFGTRASVRRGVTITTTNACWSLKRRQHRAGRRTRSALRAGAWSAAIALAVTRARCRWRHSGRARVSASGDRRPAARGARRALVGRVPSCAGQRHRRDARPQRLAIGAAVGGRVGG